MREQLETDFPAPTQNQDLPKEYRFATYHPRELIIGTPEAGVRTRAANANNMNFCSFISQIEPRDIIEAEQDEHWMMAMQEELNQFQ